MGQCMSKEQLTLPKIAQLQEQIFSCKSFSKQRLGFLQRRFQQICGGITSEMEFHQFSKLMEHLPYSSTQLTRLFSMFNISGRRGISYEELVEGLRILCYGIDECLTQVLFYMYADNALGQLTIGKETLHRFVEDHKNSYKQYHSIVKNSEDKLEEATRSSRAVIQPSSLPTRLNLYDFRPWLADNFNFKSIQLTFLKDYVDTMEQQLWKEYLSMDLFQKRICLISTHWWKNFKQYVISKYKIRFELPSDRSVKRSWTTEAQNDRVRGIKRKFSDCDLPQSQPDLEQSFSTPQRSHRFIKDVRCRNRIENNYLSGVFEGELRRGLDSHMDYILVTPRLYDKLFMLYGGGPRYERTIIKGYLQLYPIFTRELLYEQGHINDDSIIMRRYSKNDPFREISKYYRLDTVFYFRAIGQQWKKLPNDEEKLLYQFDLESNGFLINVHRSDQAKFVKQCCLSQPDINNVMYGDVFVLKNHPKQREVCVIRLNRYEVILHNLGLEGRRIYTFTISELEMVLKRPDKLITSSRMGRRGLIDLGNTSYFNACITGLFFQSQIVEQIQQISNVDLTQSTYKLILELSNESQSGTVANPKKLKSQLDKHLSQFSDLQSHDAYEFLNQVISHIEKEQSKFVNSRRVLTDLLNGKIQTTTTCNQCHNKILQSEPLTILSVPIPEERLLTFTIVMWARSGLVSYAVQVDKSGTLRDLQNAFQDVLGTVPDSYYLMEIADGDLCRNVTKLQQTRQLSELSIQPKNSLYAYPKCLEFEPCRIDPTQYRNYVSPYGEIDLCRIIENKGEDTVEVELQDLIKTYTKIVPANRLMVYNPQQNMHILLIKIISRDNFDLEKIGIPLVIGVPDWYTVAQLQKQINSRFQKAVGAYNIRYLNAHTNVCAVCNYKLKQKLSVHSQRTIGYCDNSCQPILTAPIIWYQHRVDIVIDWYDMDACSHMFKVTSGYVEKVDESAKLNNCIEEAFKEVTIIKECTQCKLNTAPHIMASLLQPPLLLILHLKRFQNTSEAINTPLQYPMVLDLKQFMFATANKEYQLVGLICHEGETLNRHYYSLIRQNEQWVLMSNQSTRREPIQKINSRHIYMMLYSSVSS